MSSPPSPPRLSDDQPQDVLGLIQGADSVELKLTVPDPGHLGLLLISQSSGLYPLVAASRAGDLYRHGQDSSKSRMRENVGRMA